MKSIRQLLIIAIGMMAFLSVGCSNEIEPKREVFSQSKDEYATVEVYGKIKACVDYNISVYQLGILTKGFPAQGFDANNGDPIPVGFTTIPTNEVSSVTICHMASIGDGNWIAFGCVTVFGKTYRFEIRQSEFMGFPAGGSAVRDENCHC